MSELDRYHIIRECRELCAELGYSGTSFKECVDECVSKQLKK